MSVTLTSDDLAEIRREFQLDNRLPLVISPFGYTIKVDGRWVAVETEPVVGEIVR